MLQDLCYIFNYPLPQKKDISLEKYWEKIKTTITFIVQIPGFKGMAEYTCPYMLIFHCYVTILRYIKLT